MQSAPCKRSAGLLNCFSPGSAPCLPAVCGSRVLRQSGSDSRCSTETDFSLIANQIRRLPANWKERKRLVEAANTIQQATSDVQLCRYKIRGRQKRKARTSGPFLRFSESYCFGSGSEPKFAWTNVHLSPFFTKTRVDFARAGSVFPSLSWITPT